MSADSGVTWSQAGHDLMGIPITALGVDSIGDIFAGTYRYKIYRYVHGATEWEEIPVGFYMAVGFAFKPGGHIFAATGQNSGVWYSDGNGAAGTWVSLGPQMPGMGGGTAIVISPSGYVFAGISGTGVWRLGPDGTWTHVVHGMKAADVPSVLVAADGGVLAGTNSAGIHRTTDGGQTWMQVAPELVSDTVGYPSMARDSQGGVYAIGPVPARSQDNGLTWASMGNMPWLSYTMAIAPSDAIFVGGWFEHGGHYDGIVRSRDAGESWEFLDFPYSDVWSLAIDPAGWIYAGGNGGLWKSDDGGDTWDPVARFEGKRIEAIAIGPNGDVFVSSPSDYALMRSSDGGNSWSVAYPHGNPQAIAINSEGRIFISYFTGGVLSSVDNGATWHDFTEGLPNLFVRAFAFDAEGHLYGGHWGSGVSRTLETTFLVKTMAIDIKPGVYPNSINLGSHGTVPVAILSSETFDATTVDPLTVTLAGANVRLKGKGTPMSSLQDVNGDERMDLLVHVETEALELTSTSEEAVLEGSTYSGRKIRGTDTVKIVPQN